MTNNLFKYYFINTLLIISYKNNEEHDLFDQICNIKANALLEQRTLTLDEANLLEALKQKSILNYNAAFETGLIMNNRYIRIGVYAVIINNNNEILLTRTQSGTRLIYNFPGGGIDKGEDFSDALHRECKEELGIEISISKLLYYSQQLYTHSDFPCSCMFNLYYVATINAPNNIAAFDCEGISWFKQDELPLDEMLDIDKEFIYFLYQKYGKIIHSKYTQI